jgi:protein-tyrosine phosphatase
MTEPTTGPRSGPGAGRDATPPDLPAPAGAPYRIAVVCLGNICRSPMAAVVLSEKVRAAGLADRVEVTSAGTGDWHVGGPMDRRAAATLAAAGYDPSGHRAQQFVADWFDRDLVLVMDSQNLVDVQELAAEGRLRPGQVRRFRVFDPLGGPDDDVPDPWTGGQEGFDEVLATVERTSEALVEELGRLLR